MKPHRSIRTPEWAATEWDGPPPSPAYRLEVADLVELLLDAADLMLSDSDQEERQSLALEVYRLLDEAELLDTPEDEDA